MRKLLASLLLLLATCGLQPLPAQSKPFYLTQHTKPFMGDSIATGVVVMMDERTMIWLNAMLQGQRKDLQEAVVCLHIAMVMPPDGFRVDSVAPAIRFDNDTMASTWRSARAHCIEDGQWAPLHFHVLVPQLMEWYRVVLRDTNYINYQCQPSYADKQPYWHRYLFNALQCGIGPDSIVTYRVKQR